MINISGINSTKIIFIFQREAQVENYFTIDIIKQSLNYSIEKNLMNMIVVARKSILRGFRRSISSPPFRSRQSTSIDEQNETDNEKRIRVYRSARHADASDQDQRTTLPQGLRKILEKLPYGMVYVYLPRSS